MLLAAIFCGSAANVSAADWSFTPMATLSQSYNSNFQFTSTPLIGTTKDDFITTFTPVFSVAGETENTKFLFETVTPALSYIKNPKYDTVNTNTDTSLTEIWSPRFSTTAFFGFAHDQTLQQQLQASGIVSPWVEHFQYTSGVGCTYGLTESVNLAVQGTYIKSVYPSGGLSDQDVYQVTVAPVWAYSERTNIGISSSYAYAVYGAGNGVLGNGTTMKTLTEMLTFERTFSETLNLKLGGGYYISDMDFYALKLEYYQPFPPYPFYLPELVVRPATATNGGFVFSADLKKDWSERLSTTLSAGRQEYNDVNATSFNSTFLSGTTSYRLSELTTINFNARYNLNEEISQGNQDVDYYAFSADLERSLTENFTLRLACSYEHEYENYVTGGTSALNLGRYIASVDLIYKWPRFFASH
jgi:hypothetical protein